MRKTRNFFLAVLGFFLLSVAFYIFTEVVWVDRRATAAVAIAPAEAVIEPAETREGDPGWLIPYEQIAFYCEHPWVIRDDLSLTDGRMDQLSDAGRPVYLPSKVQFIHRRNMLSDAFANTMQANGRDMMLRA